MSTLRRHNESGQILMLLALGLVALLGFTALAIDGGAVFFDRRSAQNAADAAALAAAHAMANDPWPLPSNNVEPTTQRYLNLKAAIINAAEDMAHQNTYGNEDGKTVVVTYPLSDLSNIHLVGGDNNRFHYVKVTITSTVTTSFLHFVYSGAVQNTVEAVSHILPPDGYPYFSGSGMVALAPHEPGAITANGNAVITVAGGGVFVNSDSTSSITATSGSLVFYTPSATTVGSYDTTKVNMNVVPGPATQNAIGSKTQYPPDLPFPDPVAKCATLNQSTTTTENINGNNYTVYSEGTWPSMPNDLYIKLSAGIHCFSIKNGGDSINNKQTVIDDGGGVLLVFTGIDPCNVTINASAHVKLTAAGGGSYKGLMMYVDPKGYTLNYNDPKTTGGGPLQLNGGENILLRGTIFAPTCTIKLNGNGGNSYRGQIVGYDFTIAGGAIVKLIYIDSENIDGKPQSILDLTQ